MGLPSMFKLGICIFSISCFSVVSFTINQYYEWTIFPVSVNGCLKLDHPIINSARETRGIKRNVCVDRGETQDTSGIRSILRLQSEFLNDKVWNLADKVTIELNWIELGEMCIKDSLFASPKYMYWNSNSAMAPWDNWMQWAHILVGQSR